MADLLRLHLSHLPLSSLSPQRARSPSTEENRRKQDTNHPVSQSANNTISSLNQPSAAALQLDEILCAPPSVVSTSRSLFTAQEEEEEARDQMAEASTSSRPLRAPGRNLLGRTGEGDRRRERTLASALSSSSKLYQPAGLASLVVLPFLLPPPFYRAGFTSE